MGLRIDISWDDHESELGYLRRIGYQVEQLLGKVDGMAQELADLQREVAEQSEVIGSAITLLNGLSERIMALRGDPRALRELASELNSQQEALAAAITANTPAEEPGEGASTAEPPSPVPSESGTPTTPEGSAEPSVISAELERTPKADEA